MHIHICGGCTSTVPGASKCRDCNDVQNTILGNVLVVRSLWSDLCPLWSEMSFAVSHPITAKIQRHYNIFSFVV